ncbi:MAG: Na+/H+ antiporter NhaC family protein [Bacteroidales bacterium]|nr:Na+/H+ antiporter NhaC family protein [Bacteroidales bacterium]
MIPVRKGLLAISPLIVFVGFYLILSIVFKDFYAIPITVAFLVSSLYAVLTLKGKTIGERVEIFSRGAGSKDLMFMIWIFILAGAFASSARSMGAVDATVNLTLHLLPHKFLLPGIFLASCFISFALGTSVGTVVALTPIAVGLAHGGEVTSVPMMVALVMGGAYFGDNLSFISDTTVVATKSQGCMMKDKFKANILLILPFAILVLILYFFLGLGIITEIETKPISILKVLPYITVIIGAVSGLNVLIVLIAGIIMTGITGLIDGSYDFIGWLHSMADGMLGMSELMIMTLLAGGMLSIIKANGGIEFLLERMAKSIKGPRGAKASIAAMVSLVNLCTANNTVAIMTTGKIASGIASRFKISPKTTASILDTASCFTQALLPYGAQMLMAAGLAELSPLEIIPYLYYPFALGIAVIFNILLHKS